MERTRIAINSQLQFDKRYGGVEQVLIGLIKALGQLDDGAEEYLIIGPHQDLDWLKPYLGPNQRLVPGPKSNDTRQPKPWLFDRELWRKVFSSAGPSRFGPEVPISDGFYERLGCHVIHFPYQDFVLCALPTIYNPHDLQHLHYPQFFSPKEIARRENTYPVGCRLAQTVVVASQWIKNDLIDHYNLSASKIQVIPWAPPTQTFPCPTDERLVAVRKEYGLELPFVFYPSVTWEHKNHLRLLRALAFVRDQNNLKVSLVLTGEKYPQFWHRIEEEIQVLGLPSQVRFLGKVPPENLRAIYRLAHLVIIPTLFEAASGPMFEAWADGAPVACSNVTSLPEQAGDAALVFDPFSVEAIADAILQMMTMPQLRAEYIEKGKARLADFSWERTAKAYRAVYRRAARQPLSEEDRWLLSWDWMRDPHRRNGKTIDEH